MFKLKVGGQAIFISAPMLQQSRRAGKTGFSAGQTTVLDPTSSLYNTYNGYSGEYDLWEYREELETTADGWDTVEHTYKTYYEKIENYWGSTEIADPKDPDKTILVPVKRSRVIEDNQNADPFENNPNVGGIRNQTPYLVLEMIMVGSVLATLELAVIPGTTSMAKAQIFYDNILELDLWIPVDSSKPIHSLRIQAIDLCNHGGDHNDIGDDLNGRTEYDNNVKISIKGLHNTLEVMNGNDVCNPGIRNPIDRIIIKSLPTVGIPRDTKTFYFEGSQGEYEQYTIIAELTKEKSVYINQFKIEILDQSHALLVVPETVGLADKKTEDANTLNLSNRILSGGYGHYKIFWEAEIYVATDTDHGCSYETENYIGIFDSDYPSSTFGWVSDNAYAPRADVYSVDRNKFLDDSTNNIFYS